MMVMVMMNVEWGVFLPKRTGRWANMTKAAPQTSVATRYRMW